MATVTFNEDYFDEHKLSMEKWCIKHWGNCDLITFNAEYSGEIDLSGSEEHVTMFKNHWILPRMVV